MIDPETGEELTTPNETLSNLQFANNEHRQRTWRSMIMFYDFTTNQDEPTELPETFTALADDQTLYRYDSRSPDQLADGFNRPIYCLWHRP